MINKINDIHQAQSYLDRFVNTNKKTHWIRDDFSIEKRGFFGNLLWRIVSLSKTLQRLFFRLDPEQAKKNLELIKGLVIKHHDDIDGIHTLSIYKKALEHFNQMFPAHKIQHELIDEIDDYLKPPLAVPVENPSEVAKTAVRIRNYENSHVDVADLSSKPIGTYTVRRSNSIPEAKIVTVYEQKEDGTSSKVEYLLKKTEDDKYVCAVVNSNYAGSIHKKVYNSIPHFLVANRDIFTNLDIPEGAIVESKSRKGEEHPAEIVPNMAKWEYCEEIQNKLKRGEFAQNLLAKAINDCQPEAARWLLFQGASLDRFKLKKGSSSKKKELVQWLRSVTKQVELKPQNLDHFALNIGYGYKAANLLMLKHRTEEINKTLQSATVKVPPFLPISDFEMRNYLLKEVPEVDKLWKQFLKSFDQDLKDQFINRAASDPKIPLRISEEGLAMIVQIKQLVIDHFEKNCYLTMQINEWLKEEKPEMLIVRSTGKEDTENNSNAGGNDSIPFIEPDPLKISATIGRVLASYFGEKSVGQRLLAGDKSLFTQETPFLPVLLQTMVLEKGDSAKEEMKDPDEIPRSGVLFTTQKDKAKGVTFIQTGLGNNEGVVSSQVAVDSYFVNTDGHVHSVVRDKKTRFIRKKMADGKFEVAQIDNHNPKVERAQALPTGVVKDLKKVADAISLHYSDHPREAKGLDMEYSVKLKEGKSVTKKPVIYLLQARPLVTAEEKTPPSYLDLNVLKNIPEDQKIPVNVLIDIRNSVREITCQEEVIFASTLPRALDAYSKMADPQKIKAIFVKKTAPSTSHESVVLRPTGVAILHVQDPTVYAKIENAVNDATEKMPLKIDTQRGLLVNTKGLKSDASLTAEGLISYPCPREVSVPLAPLFKRVYKGKNQTEIKQVIKTELNQTEALYQAVTKKLMGTHESISDSWKKKTLHELFDLMATEKEDEAKLALATLLKRLHAKVQKNIKETESFRAKYNIPLFNVYQYALDLSWKEISPAFEKTKPQSMERLYPLKFLEAAIYQQPNMDVVSGDSFAVSLHVDKKQKQGIEIAKKMNIKIQKSEDLDILKILQLGSESALNEKTVKNWASFAKDIKNRLNVKEIQQLKGSLQELQKMELLPMWLSLHFEKEWSGWNGTRQVYASLNQLMQSNQQTFEWVKENNHHLPTEEQAARYADPVFASKEIKTLKKQFLNEFGFGKDLELSIANRKNSLKERYENASPFGKLAVLRFFHEAVNSYDRVIKQVSGSTQFPKDRKEQARCFAELLEGYDEMMQTSISMIPSAKEWYLMKPTMGSFMSFYDYQKKLQNGGSYHHGGRGYLEAEGFNSLVAKTKSSDSSLIDFNAEEQFAARSEFDVSSLIIGSKADLDFSVHWPTRLEEYFTTFHQNMEQVFSILMAEANLNSNMLSAQVKEICDKIETKMEKKWTFNPGNKEDRNVQIQFQIPLRQHSGALIVKYDPRVPEAGVDITVKMSGNHEHDRWYQAAFIGAWLGNTKGLSLTSNVPPSIDWTAYSHNVQSVEFSLHIDPKYDKTEKLISLLHYTMKKMTMSSKTLDTIVDELKDMGDPTDINPEFFSSTLYGVSDMMTRISQANHPNLLSQAIHHATLNLVQNKAFNTQLGKKIVATMKPYITDLVKNSPDHIKPVLASLCARKDLHAANPDFWKFLNSELGLEG